jgi:hypothetical protein
MKLLVLIHMLLNEIYEFVVAIFIFAHTTSIYTYDGMIIVGSEKLDSRKMYGRH